MPHTHVIESFRLTGKNALVTGGARGLGKTIALALAEAGADVALCGRTRETLDETAAELAAATGRRILPLVADVTSKEDVTALKAAVTAGLGQVDILVNNAGNNIRGPIEDFAEGDWDLVIDTNLKGPFLVSQAFGPDMARRGWGRIINLGSILSAIAIPGRSPYAAAKAGVTGLTRVLALEFAAHGVTVNAICPGPFATDMNKALLDDPVRYQEFVRNIPVGRWAELDELAGLVVLLASPSSSFITGSSIYIDGGWTAR
jgi:NAD(P)-dependent dehydrogenase (short-subunit alcohol dehydrogenase family)